MKKPLTHITVSMPRTLVDLIDESAPKARSQHIISLINSFYQHPVERADLTELNDPEDEVVNFTLRLPDFIVEQLKVLGDLRFRDRNQMIQVATYTQIMLGHFR